MYPNLKILRYCCWGVTISTAKTNKKEKKRKETHIRTVMLHNATMVLYDKIVINFCEVMAPTLRQTHEQTNIRGHVFAELDIFLILAVFNVKSSASEKRCRCCSMLNVHLYKPVSMLLADNKISYRYKFMKSMDKNLISIHQYFSNILNLSNRLKSNAKYYNWSKEDHVLCFYHIVQSFICLVLLFYWCWINY